MITAKILTSLFSHSFVCLDVFLTKLAGNTMYVHTVALHMYVHVCVCVLYEARITCLSGDQWWVCAKFS